MAGKIKRKKKKKKDIIEEKKMGEKRKNGVPLGGPVSELRPALELGAFGGKKERREDYGKRRKKRRAKGQSRSRRGSGPFLLTPFP